MRRECELLPNFSLRQKQLNVAFRNCRGMNITNKIWLPLDGSLESSEKRLYFLTSLLISTIGFFGGCSERTAVDELQSSHPPGSSNIAITNEKGHRSKQESLGDFSRIPCKPISWGTYLEHVFLNNKYLGRHSLSRSVCLMGAAKSIIWLRDGSALGIPFIHPTAGCLTVRTPQCGHTVWGKNNCW